MFAIAVRDYSSGGGGAGSQEKEDDNICQETY